MTITPRDYQIEARDRIVSALTEPKDGALRNRVVGLFPTGSGKTVLAGIVLKELMSRGIRKPMFLVHTNELVQQSAASLGIMVPGATIGVVKDLGLDLAMAFAQQLAEDADPSIALKAAPWRKGKRPSIKQVEYATRLKIDVIGKTKSEIADAITMHNVERMGL